MSAEADGKTLAGAVWLLAAPRLPAAPDPIEPPKRRADQEPEHPSNPMPARKRIQYANAEEQEKHGQPCVSHARLAEATVRGK